jgi:hypothetical protein
MARPLADLESLDCPAMEIDAQRRIVALNSLAEEAGIRRGEFCWDSFGKRASISAADRAFFEAHGRVPEGGIRCGFCRADEALRTGEPVIEILDLGGAKFETHWEPTGNGTYLHYAFPVAAADGA